MAFRESFNPWVELRKSLIAWAFASSPVCSLFSQMPLGNCHCSYSKLLADPGASHTFFMLLWLEICWCFGLKCAFPLCICLIYSLSLSFKFLPTHHRNHSESLACPPLLSVPTTLGTSINEHIPRYSLTASPVCDWNLTGKKPGLWTRRAPGTAWHRTDNKCRWPNDWVNALMSEGTFTGPFFT